MNAAAGETISPLTTGLLGDHGDMEQSHHQPWGFEVAGGFVTTELRGGVSFLVSLLRNLTF
ncbi:MAG TPA: hypothetical protein VHW93_09425, partial [Acidimicrobiales bacterium]|nr:hypothetical protein [Acidimicrobiales bacterium]